jgi:hypothetical protein
MCACCLRPTTDTTAAYRTPPAVPPPTRGCEAPELDRPAGPDDERAEHHTLGSEVLGQPTQPDGADVGDELHEQDAGQQHGVRQPQLLVAVLRRNRDDRLDAVVVDQERAQKRRAAALPDLMARALQMGGKRSSGLCG